MTYHLHRAIALLQQYVPGDPSEENVERGHLAQSELRSALAPGADNWTALVLLGMTALNENRLQDAREWYARASSIDPGNADVRCILGTIEFRRWLEAGRAASRFDEAVRHLESAVELNPAHDVAMQYLGVLYRERGSAALDEDARRRDLQMAEQWKNRGADAYAEKMQAQLVNAEHRPAATGEGDAILELFARVAVMPPPPPPPPPPIAWQMKLSAAGDESGLPEEAAIVFEPMEPAEQRPRRIRIAAEVQARRLVKAVQPSVAAWGRDDSSLRFVVVIGIDGSIRSDVLIAGSPWLRHGAVRALRSYVYQPTLVDGEPVEVVTEVWVRFRTES